MSEQKGQNGVLPEVSIVLPCLNEAETVAACVNECRETLARGGFDGEIIVADNGSTDGSARLAAAEGARVIHVRDKGYGHALRGGFSAARAGIIIYFDADLSYPVDAIPIFIDKLRGNADIVIGSRMRGNMEPDAMPLLHKHFGTPFLTTLANLLFSCGTSDINSGMRGLTRDALDRLDLRSGGMELASEITVKTARLGLAADEIAIAYKRDGRTSSPNLRPFRDGWRHLFYLGRAVLLRK